MEIEVDCASFVFPNLATNFTNNGFGMDQQFSSFRHMYECGRFYKISYAGWYILDH